jgi:hypothetical protein
VKGKQLSLFNSNNECLVMLLSRLDYVCGIETTTLKLDPYCSLWVFCASFREEELLDFSHVKQVS